MKSLALRKIPMISLFWLYIMHDIHTSFWMFWWKIAWHYYSIKVVSVFLLGDAAEMRLSSRLLIVKSTTRFSSRYQQSHTNGLDATISLSTTMTAENDDLNPVASTESSLSNLSAHMPIFKNGLFAFWRHFEWVRTNSRLMIVRLFQEFSTIRGPLGSTWRSWTSFNSCSASRNRRFHRPKKFAS